MILFTKEGCQKCDWLKDHIMGMKDWPIGIQIEFLDIETYQGLAELAYLGLVGLAEKSLPILVQGNDRNEPLGVVIGSIRIKRVLVGL